MSQGGSIFVFIGYSDYLHLHAVYFLLLFGLWLFIFAIIGVRLFGGVYGPPYTTRPNFDTLWMAFIAVFQVIAVDDWNMYMYQTARAAGTWAIAFYIILVVTGICTS